MTWDMAWSRLTSVCFLEGAQVKASFLLHENSKRLISLLNFIFLCLLFFFVCVHVCVRAHTA